MPFLPRFGYNKEDEDQSGQNPSNISGTSTSFDLPGANQSTNAPKPQKKSGSWTNLNQYLSANKEQAGAMADKVTGDIDTNATQADQKLNQVKSAAPGTVAGLTGQQIKDDYLNKADLLDDTQKGAYSTFKTTGGYSGPQDIYGIDGFDDAEAFTGKASQKLQQSKTEGGRQELLKDAYKRPTYSQGQNTLDNLLVQNDAGSRDKFGAVQNKWANLTSMFDSARDDISSRISTNKATAQANKSLFPGAEDEYTNEFLNPISQRANQFNIESGAARGNVSADLSDDVLNQETLRRVGLSEGQNIYDTNLNNYISYDATQASADNVASVGERAKYAALMKLIGGEGQALTTDGKSIDPVKFDRTKFDADVKAKEDAWNQLYNDPNADQFNRWFSSVNPGGVIIPGFSQALQSSSVKDAEEKILPQMAETARQRYGEAYVEAAIKPVQDYIAWVKNQNNVNRKITKG